jgi:regulator of protease activity HflC (stomatin/prohibitin superfamily)
VYTIPAAAKKAKVEAIQAIQKAKASTIPAAAKLKSRIPAAAKKVKVEAIQAIQKAKAKAVAIKKLIAGYQENQDQKDIQVAQDLMGLMEILEKPVLLDH